MSRPKNPAQNGFARKKIRLFYANESESASCVKKNSGTHTNPRSRKKKKSRPKHNLEMIAGGSPHDSRKKTLLTHTGRLRNRVNAHFFFFSPPPLGLEPRPRQNSQTRSSFLYHTLRAREHTEKKRRLKKKNEATGDDAQVRTASNRSKPHTHTRNAKESFSVWWCVVALRIGDFFFLSA